MKKVNEFVFCPEDYEDRQDGDVKKFEMESDLGTLLGLLIKCGYQARVRSDGYCVIVEYDYEKEDLMEYSLEWVGEDEYVEKYKERTSSSTDDSKNLFGDDEDEEDDGGRTMPYFY